MEIHKGETLSGYTVSVTCDGCELTLYETDATFSDGNGEIIVDGLPEYNVETVSDAELSEMFSFAKNYFDSLKSYMSQIDSEEE